MVIVHFSPKVLLFVPLLAVLYYGASFGDGNCRCKSFGAMSIGVVDISMGMVARWADVEDVVKVVLVRGLLDKYWSITNCEAPLVSVDIGGSMARGAFREGFG